MSYAISANRLSDGIVVFFTQRGWVERLIAAERFPDAASAESALDAQVKADVSRNIVVEPGLVELREAGGHVEATHIREAIRAKGPTVRPDLGKQATS